eukprot:CAMPEP_0194073574 /NCGR_PEP_ID=MMETSP0149-20130528/944_1 /TAXON_ID=122233 /ORGANISM="Chaetoceros debilis, Strain MM31A-1" /LENGTH=551 /DNA_ID=CAMNT_0038753605 /DNA_START=142 /DNA_END=1797 /DNA_ORIENTATION=+
MEEFSDDESQPLYISPEIRTDGYGAALESATMRMSHAEESRLREHTPAYEVLRSQNLLVTAFRKECFDDVFEDDDFEAFSSRDQNFVLKMKWGVYWTPGCGFLLYKIFHKEITVPPGHVCCFIDQDNNYIFAKPGVHNVRDPFLKRIGGPIPLYHTENRSNFIEHGDRTIVTVPQGMLGFASDMGQPILLPPGMHSWKSETIRFERMYRLDDSPVLTIGPYTIVTVDDGYVAVTIANGKQVLLEGGQTHLLSHQKWKFDSFICVKMQSDDLRQINISSADNIMMNVDATINWRISNVNVAALIVSETMDRSDISIATMTMTDEEGGGLTKLRREVLKQAVAALAKFAGDVNYSEYFNYLSTLIRRNQKGVKTDDDDNNANLRSYDFVNPMFDVNGLSKAIDASNSISKEFGVEIVSMNIISAGPVNQKLMSSLATSAIASAEALQAETHARGMAVSLKIEAEASAVAQSIHAEANAKEILIKAEAEKEAEIMRAEGANEAAKLIESSQVAIKLETIKASASAIKSSDKFFFGQQPNYMPQLALNGNNGFEA